MCCCGLLRLPRTGGLLGSRQADFLVLQLSHSENRSGCCFSSTYSVPGVMQIISHGMLPSSFWAGGSPYAALRFLLSIARKCILKTFVSQVVTLWWLCAGCSPIPRCSPIEVTRCSLVVSHVAFEVGTARSESLQVVCSVKFCGGLALPWLLIKLHVVLKEDRGHQSGTGISEIQFMFVCLIKHLHCVLFTSFPFLHSLGC